MIRVQRWALVSVWVLGLAVSSVWAQGETPKKPLLIAHYMTWFGTPERSGNWYQWKFSLPTVSADKHHYPDLVLANGRRDIAAIHYPVIGPYDSSDPSVAEYHILLAKEAGIDGFMVNWYGFEDVKGRRQEDRGFQNLLEAAERLDFKVCINFDDKCSFPPYQNVTTRAEALANAKATFQRVMTGYAKSNAYLKIDGRPVISNFGWHYATSKGMDQTSFGVMEWKEIMDSLKVHKPYLIHDHQWQWRRTIEEAGFFSVSDSIFCWVGKDSDRIAFMEESRKLHKEGKLKMITGLANPGFDNTPCWGWGGGISKVPRRAGQEYRDHFEEAIQYKAGFIQLVTWNDFTEGSTIEPTEEYGNLYLRITAEYANQWNAEEPFGKSFDLPRKIYDMRVRAFRLERSRFVDAGALKTIQTHLGEAVAAFSKHDRLAAEKFLQQAASVAEGEEKKIPASKKIEAVLSPATLEVFTGESAEFKLRIKNPYSETVPVYVEVDRFGIPRSWLGELEKVVWLKAGEERELTLNVAVPADAKEVLGWLTAGVDSPYAPITSNVAYLNVARAYVRPDIGPVNLIRSGKAEKLTLSLDSRQKRVQRAKISFEVPSGWTVQPARAEQELLLQGTVEVPFSLTIPAGTVSEGELTAQIEYGSQKLTVKEPYKVLPEGKAAMLEGDINQDGVVDFALGNELMEFHVTPAVGGRMLAMVNRATGRNQLLTDYPRVQRTHGDTWDRWAEYGGINDWFPGDWPGDVWNCDWKYRAGAKDGDQVSVVFSTRTKDNLIIQREMSVSAKRSAVRVQYQLQNLTNQPREVFWTNHPDLAPGGDAGFDDQMIVPVAQAASKGPYVRNNYTPRLQKTHFVPSEGWLLAYDTKSKEYFGQVFDKSLVEKMGIWEGRNFFTMEIILKKMLLGQGQRKNFTVDYVTGQDELEAAVRTLRAKE